MKTDTYVFEDFYVRFKNLFKYFFSPSRQTARKNLKRNRTLTDSEIILLAQVLGNMTDFILAYDLLRPLQNLTPSSIILVFEHYWLTRSQYF